MLESLLIGLLYVALYALVIAIIIYAIIYLTNAFGFPLPHPIPKLLWAVGLVLVLIMLISLLFGWNPRFRVEVEPDRTIAALSACTTTYL